MVLELQNDSLRYIYSSHDDLRAEILDQDSYDFASSKWIDLLDSFNENILKLIADKLPPFQHLETYLIPPFEMTIASCLNFPDSLGKNIEDWPSWELKQALPQEQGGYLAEFLPSSDITLGSNNSNQYCLALRNNHLASMDRILRKNKLILAGIFLPQTLWMDIFLGLTGRGRPSTILIRRRRSYDLIYSDAVKFPLIIRFDAPDRQEAIHDQAESSAFEEVIEYLMTLPPSTGTSKGIEVYLIRNNLDNSQTATLNEQTAIRFSYIPDVFFEENIDSSLKLEYLLPNLAQRIIGRSIGITWK